jgi:hypothetical protein
VSGSGSSLGGVPVFKVGAEYSNASTKAKALANVRSLHTVISLSHLYKSYLFGAYFNVDFRSQKVLNNEFGFVWTPSSGAKFGIQHVAADKKPLELGKFWFYFSHAATASQTIGPYWHLIEHKEWADLTRFGAEGERIEVTGRITDGGGDAVAAGLRSADRDRAWGSGGARLPGRGDVGGLAGREAQ